MTIAKLYASILLSDEKIDHFRIIIENYLIWIDTYKYILVLNNDQFFTFGFRDIL